MPEDRIPYLIEKLLQGSADPTERDELAEWAVAAGQHGRDAAALEAAWQRFAPQDHLPDDKAAAILAAILAAPKQKPLPRIGRRWIRVAGAAAVLILLGVGYWQLHRPTTPPLAAAMPQAQRFHDDVIAPTGSRTTLTLGDGNTITLDSAASGTLAQQGGMQVQKIAKGQLAYVPTGKTGAITYNTLSTGRGGQTSVTLADGTRVWLNALSTLRFPAAFTGTERQVELTGEAYFEVAHNADAPFRVKITPSASGKDSYDLAVLGTAFDIKAYPDEALSRITLLEGAVNVSLSSGEGQRLSPGQQAQVTPGQPIRVAPDADTTAAVAWKNGYFVFHSADLASLLREAARWYDIDVEYQRTVSTRFNGEVPRSTPVSDLLKAMELTGDVKFAIEGKKITVLR